MGIQWTHFIRLSDRAVVESMLLDSNMDINANDISTPDSVLGAVARVGISGTTAKSRQRKFVPSSHPGPFALVASSHKSQTKVGTLACFDFL